ncbi:MAG: hypothetical protein V1936_02055 [Patescibacteria group bacterium]
MPNSRNFEKARENTASAKPEKVNVNELEANAEIGSAAREISADAMRAIEGADSIDESGEGFSENKGNKKDYSGSTGKSDDDSTQNLAAHVQATVSQSRMQKEVAAAIRKEIRKEERKVLLAYVGLKKYSPHRLAEKIAKIRSLRDLLSSLVDATKDFLTSLYLKWARKSV